MDKKKDFLKNKFIEFQTKIAELNHASREREASFQAREKELFLSLFEVLDAFENLDETIRGKEDGLDKTARKMAKSVRAIHKKLTRVLKANRIVKIEFPDQKAHMERCKIVDTQEAPDKENETILSVLKNGYMDERNNGPLRKAEVITVRNYSGIGEG